jgi:hypothetical protein
MIRRHPIRRKPPFVPHPQASKPKRAPRNDATHAVQWYGQASPRAHAAAAKKLNAHLGDWLIIDSAGKVLKVLSQAEFARDYDVMPESE